MGRRPADPYVVSLAFTLLVNRCSYQAFAKYGEVRRAPGAACAAGVALASGFIDDALDDALAGRDG